VKSRKGEDRGGISRVRIFPQSETYNKETQGMDAEKRGKTKTQPGDVLKVKVRKKKVRKNGGFCIVARSQETRKTRHKHLPGGWQQEQVVTKIDLEQQKRGEEIRIVAKIGKYAKGVPGNFAKVRPHQYREQPNRMEKTGGLEEG